MVQAATITHMGMVNLYASMPHYYTYFKRYAANADETSFRLALGRQLESMGQRLLDGSEQRPHLLTQEQHQIIDLMTDDLSTILRLLNRTGVIRLVDEPDVCIPLLNDLDRQLIMLLEHMWMCTSSMFCGDQEHFDRTAATMAACLAHFLDLAENRNNQLGLGWESEFRGFDSHIESNEEDI